MHLTKSLPDPLNCIDCAQNQPIPSDLVRLIIIGAISLVCCRITFGSHETRSWRPHPGALGTPVHGGNAPFNEGYILPFVTIRGRSGPTRKNLLLCQQEAGSHEVAPRLALWRRWLAADRPRIGGPEEDTGCYPQRVQPVKLG